MNEVTSIVDRRFGSEHGKLSIDGVSIERIAEATGTPMFAYSRTAIERNVARLRAALPERFDLYYSIKANPAQGLLRVFLDQGCGLEVASGGELHQALEAGCDPGRVLFAGPGKTTSELEASLRSGIGEIHAESLDEIHRLGRLAERANVRASVAVRVNPEGDAQGGAMRMGGKASPFGIDEERLDDAVDAVTAQPALDFAGVHLFIGTQILDHEVLVRQYARGIEIGVRAARRANTSLRTLDFGGGLGIPYYKGETELDVEALGRGVRRLLDEQGDHPELQGTRYLVEPGRFLVGESGVYVCAVTYVKESRGKKFVIVDGGMHHHLAASGNLGQVIKRNFPVAVLTKMDRPVSGRVDVVGPLCTPLDVLARNLECPDVEVGDLIGVFQSGAYARSASPLGFLSHPAPPEALIHGGRIERIRSRAEPRAFLDGQRLSSDAVPTEPEGS